jgi:hypothetical protein
MFIVATAPLYLLRSEERQVVARYHSSLLPLLRTELTRIQLIEAINISPLTG